MPLALRIGLPAVLRLASVASSSSSLLTSTSTSTSVHAPHSLVRSMSYKYLPTLRADTPPPEPWTPPPPRWPRPPRPTKESKTHVSIRGLPHGLTRARLLEIFNNQGIPAKTARILTWDRSDGRRISRGYGWVTLSNPKEDMERTLEVMDRFVVDGSMLRVEKMLQRMSGSFDRRERAPAPQQYRTLLPSQSHGKLLLSSPFLNKSPKRIAGPKPGEPWYTQIGAPGMDGELKALADGSEEGDLHAQAEVDQPRKKLLVRQGKNMVPKRIKKLKEPRIIAVDRNP